MIEQTKNNLNTLPDKVKADCGYNSQLKSATDLYPDVDLYVDDKKRLKDDLDMAEIKKTYDDVSFNNLVKLRSAQGRKEYTKRMHTVEPPFGHIKLNLGYRHFLVRGAYKVKGEFNLMCIGHNLKKIWNFIKKSGVRLAQAFVI
jgi:hypothetical protein